MIMSNPAAPDFPQKPDGPEPTVRTGVIPDLDGANPFGPDAPNPRADDPRGCLDELLAPPPEPPAQALPDDAFAPDEG